MQQFHFIDKTHLETRRFLPHFSSKMKSKNCCGFILNKIFCHRLHRYNFIGESDFISLIPQPFVLNLNLNIWIGVILKWISSICLNAFRFIIIIGIEICIKKFIVIIFWKWWFFSSFSFIHCGEKKITRKKLFSLF